MLQVPVSLVLVRALVRALVRVLELELALWGQCPGHPWLVA